MIARRVVVGLPWLRACRGWGTGSLQPGWRLFRLFAPACVALPLTSPHIASHVYSTARFYATDIASEPDLTSVEADCRSDFPVSCASAAFPPANRRVAVTAAQHRTRPAHVPCDPLAHANAAKVRTGTSRSAAARRRSTCGQPTPPGQPNWKSRPS